jgi:hypothetical protein
MIYVLAHPNARANAVESVRTAPDGYIVEIKPKTRSLDQNRKLWAALNDLARQVTWHGLKLTAENWKDMTTAAVKRQQVVPGIDGGFVVLGASTSKMSKAEMSELLEFIIAFGTQQNVVFGDGFDHE